jgi:hypothetical protein
VRRFEEQREEDGLRVIGEELEEGESRIALIWEKYVNGNETKSALPVIQYPQSYEFRTLEDREKSAERITKLIMAIPSDTGRRALAKRLSIILLGGQMQAEDLLKVLSEIDEFPGLITDPVQLGRLVDVGILSPATAATILGFDEEEADKAEEARVRRATKIAEAQGTLKPNNPVGVEELSVNPAEDNKNNKEKARLLRDKTARKDGPNVKLGQREK